MHRAALINVAVVGTILLLAGRAIAEEKKPSDISQVRKAAEQGDAEAQFSLGLMYYSGEGVPKDFAEAMKWYRKAAEQGYAAAQYSLGLMYYSGEGVPKDDVQAYMWLNLAGQSLEESRKVREDVARGMTPYQIAKAQALSQAWKPTTSGTSSTTTH